MDEYLKKKITDEILKEFPDGILAIDIKNRKIIEINNVATRLLGYKRNELINKDVLVLHPVEQRERIKSLILELQHRNTPYFADIPFVRKNGEVFFVDIASVKLKHNKKLIALGFLRDRKRIIQKSCHWYLLYEQLTEMTNYGVCIVCNRKFAYVNKGFVEISGGNSSIDFIGKDAFNLIPEKEQESFLCIYERLMSGAIPVAEIKQRIKRINGDEIECIIKAVRTTYNGEPAAHCVIKPVSVFNEAGNIKDLSENQRLMSTLTKRELEVMCLLAGSFTIKEIAYQLKIAYHTVMAHKQNIMKKLHLKTLSDLTRFAIKNGIAKID